VKCLTIVFFMYFSLSYFVMPLAYCVMPLAYFVMSLVFNLSLTVMYICMSIFGDTVQNLGAPSCPSEIQSSRPLSSNEKAARLHRSGHSKVNRCLAWVNFTAFEKMCGYHVVLFFTSGQNGLGYVRGSILWLCEHNKWFVSTKRLISLGKVFSVSSTIGASGLITLLVG